MYIRVGEAHRHCMKELNVKPAPPER